MIETWRLAVERAELGSAIRCWLGTGIAALAFAGVFALMLAVSRIPGAETVFPWPVGFFEKGLVIHVIMSFVVWFLAVFAALLAMMRADNPAATRSASLPISLVLATVGFVCMSTAAFLDDSVASLNNYIPVIIDPMYLTGLFCFTGAVGIVVLGFWLKASATTPETASLIHAARLYSLIFVLAVLCIALAWIGMDHHNLSERYFEDLFWGGGHVLQYLNTALMILGWYVLIQLGSGTPPLSETNLRYAMLLCLAPAVGAPFLYGIYGVNSGALISTFTTMQYLMIPPVALAGIGILRFLVRERQNLPSDPGLLCVYLSLATFAIGGFLGLFVDGADTRTPAHYHAMIAAVNLVFMGLLFRFFLPAISREALDGRPLRALVWLYAVGQMIAAIGLFMAGGYGAPRKTAGGAQGLEDLGAIAGLWMNGLGAAIAVVGGVMFIWISAKALLRHTQ